jgi:HTH-type transcriptional repressor of NAD biosynthesis genes
MAPESGSRSLAHAGGIPRFSYGLVIGKFRPPHEGHLFLIRSAAAFCKHLTVGIFDHESERLSLEARCAIFRECFPLNVYPQVYLAWGVDPHPIDYGKPDVWEKHVSVFRKTLEDALRGQGLSWKIARPEVLFTSETYGDELARRLGIPVHVNLDEARSWRPVSATQVREAPTRHWSQLPLATRTRLCLRVVVLGAESTGTTTLAQDLAAALRQRGGDLSQTRWVPEFGREFTMAKLAVARGVARSHQLLLPQMNELVWSEEDFIHIASQQLRWEEEAARETGPVLICDTDPLATTVWHERYRGKQSRELQSLTRLLPRRAFYVLTDEKDVPFDQDGFRDGEHLRTQMNARFEAVLKERNLPFFRVSGTPAERTAQVLERIDRELKRLGDFPIAAASELC